MRRSADGRYLVGAFALLWVALGGALLWTKTDFSLQFPFTLVTVVLVGAAFWGARRRTVEGGDIWMARAALLWIPTFIGDLWFHLENLNRYRILQRFPNCMADMKIAGCGSFAHLGEGSLAIGWVLCTLVALPGVLWLMWRMERILRGAEPAALHAFVTAAAVTWPMAGWMFWRGSYAGIVGFILVIVVFPGLWVSLGVLLWGLRRFFGKEQKIISV